MSVKAVRGGDRARADGERSARDVDDPEASGARLRDTLEIVIPTHELECDGDHVTELVTLRSFAGYELLGRVAVGGMAEVFLARERSEAGAARLVALKVVRAQLASDPELAEMFMREGAVALGLRHPNVCHVYRFGVENGHPFLAMELVAGVTLRDLVGRVRAEKTTIAPPIAAKIASFVAEALHSAHVARDERGRALEVVHQDVSPHNVMVAWDGTVKLLDFGVAQSSLERSVTHSSSETTPIRGKLAYLSPEQCTGTLLDGRSDVYSLGVVLFEMVTGERPFRREQALATMRAIACDPLPAEALAGVPEPLARVIRKAMEKLPHERYASAAAMQEDLERFLADQRMVVTSAKIAEAVRVLTGEDFGRAASLDTSAHVVAWLGRSQERGDPTAMPILLTRTKSTPLPPPAPRKRGIARRVLTATVSAVVLAAIAVGSAWASGGLPELTRRGRELAARAGIELAVLEGHAVAAPARAEEAAVTEGERREEVDAERGEPGPAAAVVIDEATSAGEATPVTSEGDGTGSAVVGDVSAPEPTAPTIGVPPGEIAESRSSRRARRRAARQRRRGDAAAPSGEFLADPGF